MRFVRHEFVQEFFDHALLELTLFFVDFDVSRILVTWWPSFLKAFCLSSKLNWRLLEKAGKFILYQRLLFRNFVIELIIQPLSLSFEELIPLIHVHLLKILLIIGFIILVNFLIYFNVPFIFCLIFNWWKRIIIFVIFWIIPVANLYVRLSLPYLKEASGQRSILVCAILFLNILGNV